MDVAAEMVREADGEDFKAFLQVHCIRVRWLASYSNVSHETIHTGFKRGFTDAVALALEDALRKSGRELQSDYEFPRDFLDKARAVLFPVTPAYLQRFAKLPGSSLHRKRTTGRFTEDDCKSADYAIDQLARQLKYFRFPLHSLRHF